MRIILATRRASADRDRRPLFHRATAATSNVVDRCSPFATGQVHGPVKEESGSIGKYNRNPRRVCDHGASAGLD